jgi:hypothetical protein
MPAVVVVPVAPSVVNEPVPPLKAVPVTAPAPLTLKLFPVFWNEPPLMRPPVVIAPVVDV